MENQRGTQRRSGRIHRPPRGTATPLPGPFWPLILAEHGLGLALHLGLALAAVAAGIYVVARTTGLADLGSRVDLAERSVRRGEGDSDLTEALRRDAEGDWE